MTLAHPDYCFIVGNDNFLLQEKLEDIISKFTDVKERWERKIVWGDENINDNLFTSLAQQNLFNIPHIVIIRHANELSPVMWKTLSTNLTSIGQNVWPFLFLEVDYEKQKFKIPSHIQKTAAYQNAIKNNLIYELKPLSGVQQKNYIIRTFQKAGLKPGKKALEYFIENVSASAGIINSEVDKLNLLVQSGIQLDECILAQSFNTERNIFQIIRLMEKGAISEVWKFVSSSTQNNLLFLLISLLDRELRILWQLFHKENVFLPVSDQGEKKIIARDLGVSGLSKGFSILAETEFQVKSGNQTPEQALDALIINFVKLFKRTSRE